MILMPNGLAPKRTEDLTSEEMAWLAMGEDILPKLKLTLACPRCLAAGVKTGAVLRGANASTDTVLSIACDCRQMVFRQKAG